MVKFPFKVRRLGDVCNDGRKIELNTSVHFISDFPLDKVLENREGNPHLSPSQWKVRDLRNVCNDGRKIEINTTVNFFIDFPLVKSLNNRIHRYHFVLKQMSTEEI